MKTTTSYELSFHHAPYIQKNLAELSLPLIPLTVPTREENILINNNKLSEPRRIVVETERPGRDFVVRRDDDCPLQVVQADDRRDTYGQELFRDPLDYLVLSSSEKFVWHINTPENNITDGKMLAEFVGILSNFALSKQLRLKSTD